MMRATLPAVAELGTKLTKTFYDRMFREHPELLDTFNVRNQAGGAQPKALFNSIAVSATAVLEGKPIPDGFLEPINQKHCALHVTPAQYGVVGANLLAAIEDCLSPPKDVLNAWGDFYGVLAKACIEREEAIYKQVESLPGGWRGMRDFKLVSKEKVSDETFKLEFQPTDGKPVAKHIPGQYTTLWFHPPEWEHRQPRHYSICSAPSSESYTILVKREKKGLVSPYIHDSVLPGDVVPLSPPHGDFNMANAHKLWIAHQTAPVVFISAGIGMTPVLSMLSLIQGSSDPSLGHPVTWLHASRHGGEHPYREMLRGFGRSGSLRRRVWYEEPREEDRPLQSDAPDAAYHFEGRMDLNQVTDLLPLGANAKDAMYFFCGPPEWMKSIAAQLNQLGVTKDHLAFEPFGPHSEEIIQE